MDKPRRILSIIIILISTTVSIGYCLYSFKHYHGLKEINLTQYESISGVLFNVNQLYKYNEDYDYITGWVLKKGTEIKQYNTKLVLFRKSSEKGYVLPLKMRARPDVTKAINDGIDYKYSGFEAKVDHKYMKNNSFRIGFLIDVNRKEYLVKTKFTYTYRG